MKRQFGYGKLLSATLRHHAATSATVFLGCFIGASVLIGALFVGDSMRGSLRALTMERLGRVDSALVGSRLFTGELAKRLRTNNGTQFKSIAPVILIQAAVNNPRTETTVRANIVGYDESFWGLFPADDAAQSPANMTAANQALADSLGIRAGDQVLLRVEKPTVVPREALLGDRSADRALKSVPLNVGKVIPNRNGGRFSLDASQRLPRTLYVPIESLQKPLDLEGRVNALLVEKSAAISLLEETASVKAAATLADYGLAMRSNEKFGYVSIESSSQVLSDAAVRAIEKTARKLKAEFAPVLAYLANSIDCGSHRVPYSVVVGIDPKPVGPFSGLHLVDRNMSPLRSGESLINAWTAEQLQAKPGAEIRLEYFSAKDDGKLVTETRAFRLSGIVSMEGQGIDRGFVPPFKGITDANTFGDWESPFPMDLKRVRRIDEDYWKKYRTAPKVFIGYDEAVRLWGSRFGKATAVWLSAPAGVSPAAFAKSVEAALADDLDPTAFGLTLQPIRQLALDASSGSTDFGGLFIAFSFFLIVAAGLLVGLLFRLNIERRASEIGLELAVGFDFALVRRLLLFEGFSIAALGAACGVMGAIVYARGMIAMLTTRWQSAIGLPFIEFHGTVTSAAIGAAASIAVAMAAICWAVRRFKSATVPQLMRGSFRFDDERAARSSRWSRWLWVAGALGSVVLALVGAVGRQTVACFFGAGALALAAGLFGFSSWLRRPERHLLKGSGAGAASRLAVRNLCRYPARSVLTASLIGFAAFLLVALGAMSRESHEDRLDKYSGNGGFSVLVESSAPILGDLNTADGRFQVGIADKASAEFAGWHAYAFRTKPGDDASCLNVYQPKSPTILAAPRDFIERGGFTFASTVNRSEPEKANPWKLLERDFDDGAIPAVGDSNSLQWILKKGIGEDLEIVGDDGTPVRLRVVGSLSGSMFQGQLLIAESKFLKAFPNRAGSKFILFEMTDSSRKDAASASDQLMDTLNRELSGYGVDVESPNTRIAAFAAVEKTYMAAFQSLGALGLLLGTAGLGAVLARNVLERRGELGLLLAIGFEPRLVGWLVLAESILLLLAGLTIGAGSAFVAVSPTLWSQGSVALAGVAGILLSVVATGIAAGLLALALSLRGTVVQSLRQIT